VDAIARAPPRPERGCARAVRLRDGRPDPAARGIGARLGGQAHERDLVGGGQDEDLVHRRAPRGAGDLVHEERPTARVERAGAHGDVRQPHAELAPEPVAHRRQPRGREAPLVLAGALEQVGREQEHEGRRGAEGVGEIRVLLLRGGLGGPGGRAATREPVSAARGRGGEGEEGEGGKAGRGREPGEEGRHRPERPGLGEELPADLAAQGPALLLLRGDARHRDPRGDGEEEGGNLRHEAVADREEGVPAGGLGDRHPAQRARDEAADDVHEHDGDPGDRVALHELERAVHRPVELALALEGAAPPARIALVDEARAEVRVDGHLLAGQRVEREPRRDLGDALGALGHDEELHEGEDREHHRAHHGVALHHHPPERLDDPSGLAAGEDEPRRAHVEREPEERGEEEEGREAREPQGVAGEEGHDEERGRDGEVQGEAQVEDRRGQGRDEEEEDRDDAQGEEDVARVPEPPDPGEEAVHAPPPAAAP
jgi:hypothetical protein